MSSKIECPWCGREVTLADQVCPECKHEVLQEHLNPISEASESSETYVTSDMELISNEDMIAASFRCSKCGGNEFRVKEVAMTGTGFSKIFDIEHNHYLFVSCQNCGLVEVYDPDVLRGRKSGTPGTIMDLFFGG